jgi:hypothetical protein
LVKGGFKDLVDDFLAKGGFKDLVKGGEAATGSTSGSSKKVASRI